MAAGMIGEKRMQGSIDQIESVVYFKSEFGLEHISMASLPWYSGCCSTDIRRKTPYLQERDSL